VKAYYDGIKEKQKDDALGSILEAAKSGALFGGVAGATSGLLSGQRSLRAIGMRGLGGAALTAATAAGGVGLGNAILGSPKDGEHNPYTKRAGIGGTIAGAAAGAGLGYALGAGKLRPLTSAVGSLARRFEAPTDNLIGDLVKNQMRQRSVSSGLKTAAGLGAVGAFAGGGVGLDEGMGIDFLRDDPEEMRRRQANVER
jgi:hypothetical protein